MSETTAAQEPEAADVSPKEKVPHKLGFKFDAITISVLLAIIATAFVIWDFRDVIWVNQREKTARSYIQPGKRLTQVERELNAAGFQTLYVDQTKPELQVFLIDHQPMVLEAAWKIWGHFAPPSVTSPIQDFSQRYLIATAGSDGIVSSDPVMGSRSHRIVTKYLRNPGSSGATVIPASEIPYSQN